MRKAPVLVSMVLHIGAVLLLLLITFQPPGSLVPSAVRREFTRLTAPRFKAQGGGGQRDPLPASRGAAPPRAVTKVFIAPMIVRNDNPRLAVQTALLEAPEYNIPAAVIGDPLGKLGAPSGGSGSF